MASLGEYASTLGSAVSKPAGPVVLVSGNEASDADSIITALLYAYLLQHDAANTGETTVPVVKCNRDDMKLRSETVLLLQLCGVDPSHLVFLDDASAAELLASTEKIVLVDHNAADGPLVPHGAKVVEIVDHHKDLGQHPHVSPEKRSIAFEGESATAASACSVVCEKFLAHPQGKEILARDNGAAARALLGVILIDSSNLDPKAKKVCDRDVTAAKALMELAPSPPQAELHKQLDDAKFSAPFWGSLVPAQCLRYDFKKFVGSGKSVGLSSVLCPLSVLVTKSGFVEEAQKYVNEYDLYGVMVMTKNEDGSMMRELALMPSSTISIADAIKFLMSYEAGLFQLETMELQVELPGVLAFNQKNVVPSRKQVVPACLAFFSSL